MPKKSRKNKPGGDVPLKRRAILNGTCTILAPGPITNSGRADGGWMDRVGITSAGLGHIFEPPNAMVPIDCFYSNDCYAKAGFCTLQLEMHPPLETIGDPSTQESLTEYLKGFVSANEGEFYNRGEYTLLGDIPKVIGDPSGIGSNASMIVQKAFEVRIAPSPTLPAGLTALQKYALVHFAGKGNVLFKATNFERHSPPLDYEKILGSIAYVSDEPYLGPDPNLNSCVAS